MIKRMHIIKIENNEKVLNYTKEDFLKECEQRGLNGDEIWDEQKKIIKAKKPGYTHNYITDDKNNTIYVFYNDIDDKDILDIINMSVYNDPSAFIFMDDNIVSSENITDEIINNIKSLKYKELTDEQSAVLTEVNKELLRRVRADKVKGEKALVYDLNAINKDNEEWLYEIDGDKEDAFKILIDKYTPVQKLTNDDTKAIVITHNHPNNYILSVLDISTLCNKRGFKIIVSVTNTGKISYLVKTKKFDALKYKELFQELFDLYKKRQDIDDNKKINLFLVSFFTRCSECGLYFFKEV